MAESKKRKRNPNREAAFVTYFFLILFLGMMVYFIWFLAFRSETFISSPYNSLQNLMSEYVVRGDIVSSDGEVLAATQVNGDGSETRTYPYGRLFAHAIGYESNGGFGLERQENSALLHSHTFFAAQILNDLRGEKNPGDTVVTTLSVNLQQTAYDALGSYDGAVVVMRPSTGEILAMVSKPDFNPNTIEADWESINADEDSSVLVNRATQGKYAPGSSFKIVTLLEYYREAGDGVNDFFYDCDGGFVYEDGRVISCAFGQKHGAQSLADAFANSCNGAFASLSLTLDLNRFSNLADSLLFNQDLPIALESSKSSFSLSEDASASQIMETGIGQGQTLVSPLHMLLLVSAVDNDGVLMRPYLVSGVRSDRGGRVSTEKPSEYGRLMSEEEADFLESYMRGTVTYGTAFALSSSSYTAYGKTGTAEVSDSTDQTNAWFVGYAKKDGKQDLAIAVIVENSGAGSTYAVPIAKKVFDAYFS